MDPTQPLLRPVRLGDLTLPNRIVMAPITRARATNPDLVPTDLHATYYAQRATAGLIIAEGTWVSPRAIGFPCVPGIFTDRQVAAWSRVTDLVHAVGGRIVLQLWHTGAASHPDHLGGVLPAGPSAISPREVSYTPTGPQESPTPREMTTGDIRQAIADFRTAAANARRAGFDGVELPANGPFLLTQFLNPRLNRRTDAYGEDRSKLVIEVLDAVLEQWTGRCVGVRISPFWTVRDRFHSKQVTDYPYAADDELLATFDQLVGQLSDRPVAYLHVRGRAPDHEPDIDAIARYRKLFGGPLIANHGFDRTTGNDVIERDIADAVSFARHYIANPDLVARYALGARLATSDRSTHYTGGVRGYLDYPILGGDA